MPSDWNRASLSVVVVIGDNRERAQRMIAALASQTQIDRMEVIFVDAASDRALALLLPPKPEVRVVRAEPGIMPGRARFKGTEIARAPLIAYLEDHCYPEPEWASSILAAHQGGWAAVGYTFTNGSPDTYLFRSIFLAEYGPWSHPHPGGPTWRLPGSNVSYKMSELLRFGERLADLLEMDYTLHESLRRGGKQFCIATGALVAHESYARFAELLYCHFLFSRLQAARRARAFGWKAGRRLVLSLAVPIVLPWMQLYRAWKAFRRHSSFPAWLASIPVIYLIHQSESIGESLGLLFGAGNCSRRFALRELNGTRMCR